MESFENFEPSSQEAGPENTSLSPEASQESREKAKKAGARAIAQIARSRKDESIAYSQDLLLARVIRRMIGTEVPQSALSLLLDIRAAQVPSHLSIALISLVSSEAREEILSHYHRVDTFPKCPQRSELVKFSESALYPEEKMSINAWIELIFIIVTESPSTTRTGVIHRMLNHSEEQSILDGVNGVLSLFCTYQNITPTR